jgi:hypothetical protein
MLIEYIKHSREFEFMSGIERDTLRIKETAEVFTPTSLVIELLDSLPSELFKDETKTFIDPTCGDGQFLSEIVIRKMEYSGCTLETALSATYGVELMQDNVNLCKKRLAGPNPTQKILDILNKNIVCADSLKYNYSFGEPVGIEVWCNLEK